MRHEHARYNDQPACVKLFRRLRHGVPLLFVFVWCQAKWALHGFEFDPSVFVGCNTKWQVFCRSCRVWKSIWDLKCGNYVTMQEMLAKLKA